MKKRLFLLALLSATLLTAAEEDYIEKIVMPPRTKQHAAYPDAQDITIKNGSFYRYGVPWFVSGQWQTDAEGISWQHRLFSADVCTYNPEMCFTAYGLKKGKDGKKRFFLSPNPWYEALINRFLVSKVKFWHEHKGGKPAADKVSPWTEAIGAGHFVPFDPYHPLGPALYQELYKTWMRYTQNYPVFCYELFNEMCYENMKKITRDAFREEMKKKYGSVAKLNKAWKTSFRSFDDVDAPGYLTDHGNKNIPREKFFHAEGKKYPNLLVDWQKFEEQRCYDAIQKLMPMMRAYDPDKKVFSTTQSHNNWWMDHTQSYVKPEAIRDFSDFVSHEIGVGLIESGSYRCYEYAQKMIGQGMIGDLVKNIADGKPVYNAESNFVVVSRGVAEAELIASDYAAMTKDWKFFDGTKAVPQNWNAAKLDISKWGQIRVPDMWGKCGYTQCQVGLYRKNFSLTGDQLSEKVYLNGKGLADSGEIYVNGKFVGSVKGFNAPFTFDISQVVQKENSIAVRIVNKFYLGGMYYGGIRGFLSVNGARLMADASIGFEPRHFRSFYWMQATHGMNGIMLSYNIPQHTLAARTIPFVKAELENTADFLFLKENHAPADTALFYPFETMFTVLHKDFLQKLEGPATLDILPYYSAFLFNSYAPDVVRASEFAKKASQYRIITMPNNIRATKKTFDLLKDYVKKGGIIVTNYSSLTVEDDSHEAMDPSSLTGVKYGTFFKNDKYDVPGLGKGTFSQRFIDGTYGAKLILTSAKPYLKFADGSTAVAVNSLGKGKVYTIAGNFKYSEVAKLVTSLAAKAGAKKEVVLAKRGKAFLPEYLEARQYRKADGSRFLYFQNYDVPGAGLVKLSDASGNYLVRNVETNKVIQSPSGKKLWSEKELKAGMPVAFRQFSPVVLLLEPEKVTPRKFRGVSPTRLAMLNEVWKKMPEDPKGPRVGITELSLMSKIHGTMPTVHRLLTDNGFRVRNIGTDSFKDLDIVFYKHLRDKCKNPEALLKFVREGGSLLILGSGPLNYHTATSNYHLWAKLGISQSYIPNALYCKTPRLPEKDCLNVDCFPAGNHPIVENVKRFETSCAGWINRMPKNAVVLLKSGEDSKTPGKPIACAFEYGKGRVVFLTDFWVFRPLAFERADNAQFLLNVMKWLGRKPGVKLTDEAKKKSLFMTEEKFRKAEKEEKEGIVTFEAPKIYPSWLEHIDVKAMKGIAGGDPIVDAMKNF